VTARWLSGEAGEPFGDFVRSWPTVDGLKIHTRRSTAAPPGAASLVLVHGLGVSARYLAPTAARLARDFEVIAPELPGFGRSDKPARALDIAQLADVLAAWLPTAGVTRASFLGNSMGCQVIVDMAMRYPHCIDRAILVGPTVDTVDRTFPRQLWRGARDLIHEPWSLLPILAADYFKTGTRRIYRTCRYALADSVERKLPLVEAPCLVVRGSRDPLAPQRWIEEMARLLPNGQSAVISGGTHAANYSAADQLAQLTRDFLAGSPRASA
jgi:2-hydroxy-6-oxonona-2,4-dienedioate hydrolase